MENMKIKNEKPMTSVSEEEPTFDPKSELPQFKQPTIDLLATSPIDNNSDTSSKTVSMYSVINSKAFKESKMELPIALGRNTANDVYIFDLAKMPHLLVAGYTGYGKTVCVNAIITSLLYKKHPSQLKFVMIDPKMVEFGIYEGLKKHYMAQYPDEEDIIVTDCMKVITTLNSLVKEMEERYRLLQNAQCRNIIEYNDKFIHRHLSPTLGHKYLPYIVIVIDEFGDLMLQAGKEIEIPIVRIAQKSRAVGMHLILVTQRPCRKIITGLLKANIPGRIAFHTESRTDSKIILDERGAEELTGKGDLLISTGQKPERVQCAFADTSEIERIIDFISSQQGYCQPMQLPTIDQISDKTYAFVDEEDENDDYHDFTFITDGYFTLKDLLRETFDCLETPNEKRKLIDAAIEDLRELREEIEKNKVG